MKSTLLMLLVFLTCTSFGPRSSAPSVVKMYSEEVKLYNLIMELRKQHNLPAIPLSKALTYVAQERCSNSAGNECNQCMWDKPKEMTSYEGNGYEIAYATCSASRGSCAIINAQKVFNRWMGSSQYSDIFLSNGVWKRFEWNAIGIGIKKGHATVWFGRDVDKEGSPVYEE